jgi:peroxiredoxin
MKDRTETLKIGDRAPEFKLPAANDTPIAKVRQNVSLSQLVARGPVVMEFLRGTW